MFRKGTRVSVRDNAKLTIGKNTTFNTGCIITCRDSITIGEKVAFAQNVLILDHDHDYKHDMSKYTTDSVEIGNNCWIGANVIILKGTKIGDNCVIGAGTVIKGTVEANTVVYNKQNLVYKQYKSEE